MFIQIKVVSPMYDLLNYHIKVCLHIIMDNT